MIIKEWLCVGNMFLLMFLVDQVRSACHGSCLTCDVQNSKYSCQTCDTSQFRTLKGTAPSICACNKGYLENSDIANFTCVTGSCHYSCPSDCQDTSTKCMSCPSGSNRVLVGTTCPCSAGFYDPGELACIACDPKCKSCAVTSTNCTDCNVLLFRQLNSTAFSCQCVAGYYENSAGTCSKCKSGCTKCTSQTVCTVCTSTTTREPPSCGCKNLSFYDDGTSIECKACHYSCKTCINNLACTSCDSSNNRAFSSTTGRCQCRPKYYNVGSTPLCSACHITCLTCNGITDTTCLTCLQTTNREFVTTSKTCTCKAGYYSITGQADCGVCSPTCQKCSVSSTNCSACDNLKFRTLLNSSSTCICSPKYYESADKTCVPCHSSCATCTNGSSCTGCMIGLDSDTVTKLCICGVGKYLNLTATTPACAACNVKCQTCRTNATNCTSCSQTNFRKLSGSSCVCIAKYYEDGTNALCKACHYTCLTCTSNTNTTCLTCDSAKRRTKNGTSCLCQNGYYDDGMNLNQLCLKCSPTCLTCRSSGCATCDSSSFRFLNGSVCSCRAGYFEPYTGALVCEPCSNKCATCVTNRTNCQSCAGSSATRNMTASNCSCTSAKYFDNGISGACIACNHSCNSCVNATSCSSCNNNITVNRVYNPATTLCSCKLRYYDNKTEACVACHLTCLTCNGTSSTNCLSCNTTANRVLSATNACVCMPSTRENSTTSEFCIACHRTCLTCVSNTDTSCRSCDSAQNRQYDSANFKCICVNKFFLNSETLLCVACHPTCGTCRSLSTCDTCLSTTQTLNRTSGFCQCPAGTAWNVAQAMCDVCNYTCLSCSILTTNCTSCNQSNFRYKQSQSCPCKLGYSDNQVALCVLCNYKCLTCSSATTCLSCSKENFRVLNGTNCVCQNGYYDDGIGLMCLKCQSSCLTCPNGVRCSTCDTKANKQINSTSQLCSCMVKFYEDAATQECKKCAYHCASCALPDECTSCEYAVNKRILNPNSKICYCQVGYFDNGSIQKCQLCPYDCKSCLSFAGCQTCSIQKFRVYNQPNKRCLCIQKYYDNKTATCLACNYTCLTCTNSSVCLTCNLTANRLRNSTTGRCFCAQGYYDNGVDEQCARCHYSCVRCSNGNSCLNCDSKTLRTLSGLCVCPSLRYYDDGSTKDCQKCHYSCQTCTSLASCSICNTTARFRTYDSVTQYCKCTDGYFDDGQSNQLCQKCSFQCQTCKQFGACLTCDTLNNFRYLPQDKCKCIPGYYEIPRNPVCAKCHYSCQTCLTGNECSTCNTLKYRAYDEPTRRCRCAIGYFDNLAETCQACSYSCLQCSGTSLTCTKCDATSYRTLNTITKTCTCNRFYFDDLSSPQCVACHYSCLSCSSAQTCLTCDSTKFRQIDQITSVCRCQPGYFDDGFNNQVCVKCQQSCLRCSSTQSCTACETSRKRVINNTANFQNIISPYCICQYKYYPQANVNATCLPCHYSCGVCSAGNNTSCLFCSEDAKRVLDSATGKCLCLDGYFDNGATQTCTQCNPLCLKCTNSTTTSCSQCISSVFLKLDVKTCFQSCPSTTFGQKQTMTCQPCQQSCLTCQNAQFCLACNSSKKLYNGDCVTSCPAQSTYQNTTSKLCISCPQGCLTCSSNIRCLTCIEGFMLISSTNLCIKCNEKCSACNGPSQYNCTDCDDPLVLKNGQCLPLKCQKGTYPNAISGKCTSCRQKHGWGVQTCKSRRALSCQRTHVLVGRKCVYCTFVDGYVFSYTQGCTQQCGDGVVINLPCDDGNKDNGDGCSSMCTIEPGWQCKLNRKNSSICQYNQDLQLKFQNSRKLSGRNTMQLMNQLSADIKMNTKSISLTIKNKPVNFEITQQKDNLKNVIVSFNYQSTIQNQKINVKLARNNRTSRIGGGRFIFVNNQTHIESSTDQILRRSLQDAVDSGQIVVKTFPPAIFYPDQQMKSFQYLRNVLYLSNIVLLVICAVNFRFVKRMYIHIFVGVWLPAQIFLFYGMMIREYTDWLKYTLENNGIFALAAGFKILNYNGLPVLSQINYIVSITETAGYSCVVMIGLWLLYGCLNLCRMLFCKRSTNLKKVIMYVRYIILTVQICLIPNVAYCAFKSLLYSSFDSLAAIAINTCFAIAINFYLIGFIVVLFLITKRTRPSIIMILSQTPASYVQDLQKMMILQNCQENEVKNYSIQLKYSKKSPIQTENQLQNMTQTQKRQHLNKRTLNQLKPSLKYKQQPQTFNKIVTDLQTQLQKQIQQQLKIEDEEDQQFSQQMDNPFSSQEQNQDNLKGKGKQRNIENNIFGSGQVKEQQEDQFSQDQDYMLDQDYNQSQSQGQDQKQEINKQVVQNQQQKQQQQQKKQSEPKKLQEQKKQVSSSEQQPKIQPKQKKQPKQPKILPPIMTQQQKQAHIKRQLKKQQKKRKRRLQQRKSKKEKLLQQKRQKQKQKQIQMQMQKRKQRIRQMQRQKQKEKQKDAQRQKDRQRIKQQKLKRQMQIVQREKQKQLELAERQRRRQLQLIQKQKERQIQRQRQIIERKKVQVLQYQSDDQLPKSNSQQNKKQVQLGKQFAQDQAYQNNYGYPYQQSQVQTQAQIQNIKKNDNVLAPYHGLGSFYYYQFQYKKVQEEYMQKWIMYDFIEAYKTGGYKYVRKGQKIANIFELNYDSEAENVEADQEDLQKLKDNNILINDQNKNIFDKEYHGQQVDSQNKKRNANYYAINSQKNLVTKDPLDLLQQQIKVSPAQNQDNLKIQKSPNTEQDTLIQKPDHPQKIKQKTYKKFQKSKYYLPFAVLKIYLSCMVAAYTETQYYSQPYYGLIFLLILNIGFIIYVSAVRPFKQMYSNVRIIITQALYIVMNSIMLYFSLFIKQENYDLELIPKLEKMMIYLMIVSVNVASVMIVLELFFSMKNKIMNSIENFFISLRLKGAKNVLEYVKFDQEQIGNIDLSNQNIEQQKEEQKMYHNLFARYVRTLLRSYKKKQKAQQMERQKKKEARRLRQLEKKRLEEERIERQRERQSRNSRRRQSEIGTVEQIQSSAL